jgi:hypothetical protein
MSDYSTKLAKVDGTEIATFLKGLFGKFAAPLLGYDSQYMLSDVMKAINEGNGSKLDENMIFQVDDTETGLQFIDVLDGQEGDAGKKIVMVGRSTYDFIKSEVEKDKTLDTPEKIEARIQEVCLTAYEKPELVFGQKLGTLFNTISSASGAIASGKNWITSIKDTISNGISSLTGNSHSDPSPDPT